MTKIYAESYREADELIENLESLIPFAKRHSIQCGTEYLDCMNNSLAVITLYGDEINGYTVTLY